MFVFIVAAVASFAALWLVAPVWQAFAALAEPDPQAHPKPVLRTGVLAARAVAGFACVALVVDAGWEWSLGWSSSDNFRITTGFVTGGLAWALMRQLAIGGGADANTRGWGPVNAPVLLAAGLGLLWIWTLSAPYGEIDLAGVRTLKTPFLEAQFSRNETVRRLNLESEPQGFFRLRPDGLGDALHLARNEVVYQRWGQAKPDDAALDDAERARRFLVEVLQPAARCTQLVDELYGDRKLLVDTLHVVGTALARAVVIAARPLDGVPEGTADPRDAMVRTALEEPLGELRRRVTNLLPPTSSAASLHKVAGPADPGLVRIGTAPGATRVAMTAAADHPCAALVPEALAGFEDGLAEVVRHPSTVHASAMFLFWSGNPQAVLRMIENAAVDERRAHNGGGHPRLHHLRGFAKRWSEAPDTNPRTYLAEWEAAIEDFEARLDALRERHPDLVEDCGHRSRRPVTLSLAQATGAPMAAEGEGDADHAEAFPEDCAEDPMRCQVELAYGYFLFDTFKLRNHVVYESARELLTGRSLAGRERLVEAGRRHADLLKAWIDDDVLGAGGCLAQQRLAIAPRERGDIRPAAGRASTLHVAVTTANPEHTYAVALDSYGNMLLAEAFYGTTVDHDLAEAANAAFGEALQRGAASDLGDRMLATFREHRREARRALGLPGS